MRANASGTGQKMGQLTRSPDLSVSTSVPIFIVGTCSIRTSCRVLHTPNFAAVIDDTENSCCGGADRQEGDRLVKLHNGRIKVM